HFEQCFYQQSRREAATADLLVVNHHLLFSDIAVRQAQGNYDAPAVLPQYKRLVLDEAHNLEDVATRHLGATVSRRGLYRFLRRLEHRGRGVLPALANVLIGGRWDLISQGATDLLAEQIFPSLDGAREAAGRLFDQLQSLLLEHNESMLRVTPAVVADPRWQQEVTEERRARVTNLEVLLRSFDELRKRIGVDEEAVRALEPQLLELRGAANRLDSAVLAVRTTLNP